MIRRATIHDVYQLTLLFRSHLKALGGDKREDRADDVDYMASALSSPSRFVVVSVERKKVVGYAQATVYYDFNSVGVVVIDAVYVDAKHRAKGIGKQLYLSAIAFGKSRGAQRVECHIPSGYKNDAIIKRSGMTPYATIYSMKIEGGDNGNIS